MRSFNPPFLKNLCAECRNVDQHSEYVGQVYQEVQVCLYQRGVFPRATNCVDFEPVSTTLRMRLKRFHFGKEYTVGRLHIDDAFQCYTLEDEVREIETRPCAEWKIHGRTAIPRGTYQVVVNYSNRFNRPMPLLLEVPCFEGVRIHSGNQSSDTEGCILVGTDWDGGDWISHSRAAYDVLMSKIQSARLDSKHIYLEVE